VILPVILDQQPRSVTKPLTLRIPGMETESPAPAAPPSLQPPRVAPKVEENPGSSPTDTTSKSRAQARKTARKEELQRAKAKEAEVRRDAYVVPLGAFTHADNAKQVRDKATSAGIKSYTETVKVAQGESTRVRAGPFANRDSAEKARQKLKSLGMEVGQVVQK